LLTYLITRCHGLITHLLTPQIVNSLATAKNFQEIVDILTPTDYGKCLRDQEEVNAFTLEEILKKMLMNRCEYLLQAAPDSIKEFLLDYYGRFEVQNISRIFRGKISRAPIEASEYALFPIQNFSTLEIGSMAEADDAEEFIVSLKKTPYRDVVNSIKWYRKYDSFLPIEYHLKKIYYDRLFQALKFLPEESRKNAGRLIRLEVDIANCFTSIAASVYGYDKELVESLLIPYPLKLSIKTLKSAINTESPHDILGHLRPYSEIVKLLLDKDEIEAHTEAMRLLRNEVIHHKIIVSLDFTYVIYYLLLCEFECRDLTFIALAIQHNIMPGDNLISKG